MDLKGRTNTVHELADEAALSADERAILRCRLAKGREGTGDYEGGREILLPYWPRAAEHPSVEGLSDEAAAEVMLRAGVLTRWGVGTTRGHPQETARDLITKSLLLFERLGLTGRVAEARAELAYSYWRVGAFDEARALLSEALAVLGSASGEVRALVLLRQALVENSATRYNDAHWILRESAPLFEALDNHTLRGSFHNELAFSYERLGTAERRADYTDRALVEATAASFHFEQAGHTRYQAHVENNLGFLFHSLGRHEEAHEHLDRARELFASLHDQVFASQVDETRARVLIAQGRAAEAERAARVAADVFERVGEYGLLAEALITSGKAQARLKRWDEARASFSRAASVAEDGGSTEFAGLACLTLIEELSERLDRRELRDGYRRADASLAHSQDPDILARLRQAARHALNATDPLETSTAPPPSPSAGAPSEPSASEIDAVGQLVGEILGQSGRQVSFTQEAVEEMRRLFTGEGLRSLKLLLEETLRAAPAGTVIGPEEIEVVSLRRRAPRGNFASPWTDFSLKEELREREQRFIELALKAGGGKISVAARLLGFNHNELLTSIIKSRYPELLAARIPPVPRKRSIIPKRRR